MESITTTTMATDSPSTINMDNSTQIIDEEHGNGVSYELIPPIRMDEKQEVEEENIPNISSSVNEETSMKSDLLRETTATPRELHISPENPTMVIAETSREPKESHSHIRNSQMKTVRLEISLKDGYEFSFKEVIGKQQRLMEKSSPVDLSIQLFKGGEEMAPHPSEISDEDDPSLDKLIDGTSLDVSCFVSVFFLVIDLYWEDGLCVFYESAYLDMIYHSLGDLWKR
jgi:hypothetical protein